jgi:hypothetical protein
MLFLFTAISAQSENKDVTITTTGSGPTLEIAKQNALRSAIEQTYGAFISTKTEIFNDQVVADEMSSVSSGNLKSFEILNQNQITDSMWRVTLKSLVSISNLSSFVRAKGIEIPINGDIIAFNIKLQQLNENNELKIVYNTVGQCHNILQTAFDFTISNDEPKQINSENWVIPINVKATLNNNYLVFINYLKNDLKALSLNDVEIEKYEKSNRKVFRIELDGINYYLRNRKSLECLHFLLSNELLYLSNFEIDYSKIGVLNSKEKYQDPYSYKAIGKYNLGYFRHDHNEESYSILYLGRYKEMTFEFEHNLNLSQLEKLKNYKIKSKGIQFPFIYGGIMVKNRNTRFTKFWGIKFRKINSSCLVSYVYPNSNAYKAGLREFNYVQDHIKINGIYPRDFNYSFNLDSLLNVDDKLKIKIPGNGSQVLVPELFENNDFIVTYVSFTVDEFEKIENKASWQLPNVVDLQKIEELNINYKIFENFKFCFENYAVSPYFKTFDGFSFPIFGIENERTDFESFRDGNWFKYKTFFIKKMNIEK